MATQTAKQIADSFDRRAQRLERLGPEATRLRLASQMSQASVDSIYEAAMLNLVASFERSIEDLFYSVLLGQSAIRGAHGRVSFRHRAEAERVLVGSRDYLQWLPIEDHAFALGERLLVQSPFLRLQRQTFEKQLLRDVTKVRNAIAHDSGTAKVKFAPLAAHLRRGRRTPAGLLQEVRQGVTVHEYYCQQLRLLIRALAAPAVADAKRLLGPEEPHKQGAAPGRGTYDCVTCNSSLTLAAANSVLPQCAKCFSNWAAANPPCQSCGATGAGKIKPSRWQRQSCLP